MATAPSGQTAIIGGQTVRLASSPAGGSAGTLLKAGTHLASPGGKQIILQKQGLGGGVGQPQIVTLVKTSQGMQVATVPKASIVQGGKPGAAQQIVQAAPGKTIPQGATIVKLVNAPGGAAGGAHKIVTNVKSLGSNVMTVAKPGGGTIQMAAGASSVGKQTFMINKPAGTMLKGPGGQQIIVVSSGSNMKTVQALTTSQAGAGTMTTAGGQRLMVVNSSQLTSGTASATNRPITISVPGQGGGAAKTVTLAGTAGGARLATGATQVGVVSVTRLILILPKAEILFYFNVLCYKAFLSLSPLV